MAAIVVIVAMSTVCPAADQVDSTPGRNLYVDPVRGDDRNSGLAPQQQGADGPVKTIHHAVRRAKSGDTIHLAPSDAPYHDVIAFHDSHGEPGRPITFDGHDAALSGAEPLNIADWREVSPGLYRCDQLIPARFVNDEDALSRRWFFLFDGRINRMGRTLKGKNAPYKSPAELQPGEWTYQKSENAFYLKIAPSRQLADCHIEYPLRMNGVSTSGDCSHLVVKNLVVKHVLNDGYNLHGKSRDVRFENIAAYECGDDGFSAHDDCEATVDGFVSSGNSTGIANVGASKTANRRVVLKRNVGTDLLLLGSGMHEFSDSIVRCSAAYSLNVSSDGPQATCLVRFQNVLIARAGDTSPIKCSTGAQIEAQRITILGLDLQASAGEVALSRSVVAGSPQPGISIAADAHWKAEHNLYDLRELELGDRSYDAAMFADYQRQSDQDAHSRWAAVGVDQEGKGGLASSQADVGVNLKALPPEGPIEAR